MSYDIDYSWSVVAWRLRVEMFWTVWGPVAQFALCAGTLFHFQTSLT
jgi:thiamine kinase-like enzyme